jgi:hypothetical protein
VGILLVNDDDAGGDARAIEKVLTSRISDPEIPQ